MNPRGEGARLLDLLPALFLFPACYSGSAREGNVWTTSATSRAVVVTP
jgi:hypothetical protein